MSRDYAVRRKPPARKSVPAVPGWVWLFAGLSIGLAVAAVAYVTRPAAPMPGADARRASQEPVAERRKVEVPPKEKSRFTFYELLPSQEVVIREDAADPPAPAAKKKPVAESGKGYIIHVASYHEHGNAEEQKAQLAMLGMESRIEKITIDNRDTYYRVRIGPEPSLSRAQSMLAQLRSQGIEAIVVELK